jgi:small-conductance mechanosensitive channel
MNTDTLAHMIASGLLVVVLTALGVILVQILSRRGLAATRATRRVGEAQRQQITTVVHVIRWVADVVLVVTALLTLLAIFGVNIAPLLASAGVAGLALSLGLQSLIKDLVSGLLIVLENQFSVGDSIEVGNVSGQVERITLRTTHLRNVDGRLHIVPNGEVRIVTNLTREWSRAIVDFKIDNSQEMDRIVKVLTEASETFAQDPIQSPMLLENPQVVSPLRGADGSVQVRVMVKTVAGKQWEVMRELEKWLLDACRQEGITLSPAPPAV